MTGFAERCAVLASLLGARVGLRPGLYRGGSEVALQVPRPAVRWITGAVLFGLVVLFALAVTP